MLKQVQEEKLWTCTCVYWVTEDEVIPQNKCLGKNRWRTVPKLGEPLKSQKSKTQWSTNWKAEGGRFPPAIAFGSSWTRRPSTQQMRFSKVAPILLEDFRVQTRLFMTRMFFARMSSQIQIWDSCHAKWRYAGEDQAGCEWNTPSFEWLIPFPLWCVTYLCPYIN